MTEIPKTNCKGCDDRDRMIQVLSQRIDELEGNTQPETTEIETAMTLTAEASR